MWSKMPVFTCNGWKLVKSLKIGNMTGIDNIPSEAIQAGGGVSIEALYKLINEIWRLTRTPLSKVQTFLATGNSTRYLVSSGQMSSQTKSCGKIRTRRCCNHNKMKEVEMDQPYLKKG